MAKLKFDPVTFTVRDLLDQGRMPEAKALVIEKLRAGYNSELLELVADLLVDKKRGRGAPRKKLPHKWYEIGMDFVELRNKGRTYDRAIAVLARKHKRTRNTIIATVSGFEEAYDASWRPN